MCAHGHGRGTLDPIRCTLYVKPGGDRVLTSGQNQLFPSRGYTAETYAKVMGSSSPSQPRIKPKYTLFVCKWIVGDGWVLPPIVYTVSPPLRGGVAFAPELGCNRPRRRRRTMLVVKHQVKDEDGVPCYVYKMPSRMLGKVGSGSSSDRFLQKGAEWADVKAQP